MSDQRRPLDQKGQGMQTGRKWLGGVGLLALLLVLWLGTKLVGRSVGRQMAVSSVEQESLEQQAPPGFLRAKWLMSMHEVRTLHPNAVTFAPDNLKLEAAAFGRPAFIDFIFKNDLLLIIVVSFKGEKTEATYAQTQARLVEEYGVFPEPQATVDHRLASRRQAGRVVVQHLLYEKLGVPLEQVLLYRTE